MIIDDANIAQKNVKNKIYVLNLLILLLWMKKNIKNDQILEKYCYLCSEILTCAVEKIRYLLSICEQIRF